MPGTNRLLHLVRDSFARLEAVVGDGAAALLQLFHRGIGQLFTVPDDVIAADPPPPPKRVDHGRTHVISISIRPHAYSSDKA